MVEGSHHQCQDRHTGDNVCHEVTIPMHVGVPYAAVSLTGGKSASSVRELPPPKRFAVSDGKKNAASDNLARVPSLG